VSRLRIGITTCASRRRLRINWQARRQAQGQNSIDEAQQLQMARASLLLVMKVQLVVNVRAMAQPLQQL
jgi:hypothetical protein